MAQELWLSNYLIQSSRSIVISMQVYVLASRFKMVQTDENLVDNSAC